MTNELVYVVVSNTNAIPVMLLSTWDRDQALFFHGFGVGCVLFGIWLAAVVVKRAASGKFFGGGNNE